MGTGGGVEVLGPVAIDGDTNSIGPRDRVVLGVLVLRRGNAVDTDVLADALWGDDPPATANKVVQGCVARLRKSLGSGAIETVPHGYRLEVPSDRVDVGRFERLIARSRELLSLGEVERAAHAAGEALDLWRGRPFADLEEWAPGRAEAARLDELRLDAEELRVDAELRSGRVREVMAEAQRLVGAAPFRERRWALLATAQYQAGRQADALATIRQARRLLAEELGLDPGPDLVALEDAILQQDPSLAPASAEPAPSSTCPYRGLVPYDVEDSDAFFGRDEDLGECLRRLADSGVVVVVGPSGSGKSSLVRAGVAASLERDGERVTVITPGVHPMDELASVRWGVRTTVVVDQCEEVVTVCRDPDERLRFLDAVVGHAEHGRLVVALRADRLGEVSAHAPFARLVERGLYLLQPMDESHLRAAIEGPAHQAGLRLEPGLVDLLVRDVEGEPGALPLLSHALRQTWERREGRTLTVEGYQASGGIRGAVAQTAESVFEEASPEQRPMLRDLMLRLVAPSPEGEPVRSRVARRTVAADAEHEELVERLVAARLVTSDEESVELAHEALARAWPRLREWLDDDVEGQRIWRHLGASADAWSAMDRPDSELYRGARLARAVEWRSNSEPDLNPNEAEFLDASARREEREKQARRRRQRRTLAIVGTAAVIALVLAAVAVVARNDAAEQRDVASEQRDVAALERDAADRARDAAEARRLMASSSAVLDTDPELSLLLAIDAAQRLPGDVEAGTTLHAATTASRTLQALTWPVEPVQNTIIDITGDGSTIAWAGSPGSVVEVRDVDSGSVRWRHEFEAEDPTELRLSARFVNADQELLVAVMYSPSDGAVAADAPDDAGVHVFDVATGTVLRRLPTTACGAWHAAGGFWVAVTSADPDRFDVLNQYSESTTLEYGCPALGDDTRISIDVLRVDVLTGAHVPILDEQPVSYFEHYVGLSRDGRVASVDQGLSQEPRRVIAVETGEVLLELPRTDDYGPTSLNADGSRVAFTGEPGAEIYDVASGDRMAVTAGHFGGVRTFNSVFSPDGRRLYTGGGDGAARVWDAVTGVELDSAGGMSAPVIEARGGGDGMRVAFSTFGAEARVTDLTPGGRPERSVPPDCADSATVDLARREGGLDLRGDRLLSFVSCDGPLQKSRAFISAVDVGEPVTDVPGFGLLVGWSDDGDVLVAQDWAVDEEELGGGRLRAYDASTGEQIVEFDDLCTAIAELPVQAASGDVVLPSAEPCGQPRYTGILHVVISPDNALVAVGVETGGDPDRYVVLAEMDGGAVRGVFAGGAIELARGGSELLVSHGLDGRWTAYDTETLEVLRTAPPLGFPIEEVHYDPTIDQLIGRGPVNLVGSTVLRFDVETLEPIGEIPDTHESSLADIHVQPAAGLVASAGVDGHAKVWDLASGELLHDVIVGDVVVAVAVSEDGRTLYTATDQGPVVGWSLDLDELVGVARSRITRGFTDAECARYFPDEECPPYEPAGAESDGA